MWTPLAYVGVAVGVGARCKRTLGRGRHFVAATNGAHERSYTRESSSHRAIYCAHTSDRHTPLGLPEGSKRASVQQRGRNPSPSAS